MLTTELTVKSLMTERISRPGIVFTGCKRIGLYSAHLKEGPDGVTIHQYNFAPFECTRSSVKEEKRK